jgi:hypothetical protein
MATPFPVASIATPIGTMPAPGGHKSSGRHPRDPRPGRDEVGQRTASRVKAESGRFGCRDRELI